MFKYLKTADSDFHPSEVIELFAYDSGGDDAEVPEGSLICIEEGMVRLDCIHGMPLYLALTGKKLRGEGYIKCTPVLSNMIFEATIDPDEDPSIFFVGSMCRIFCDQSCKGIGVTVELNFERAAFRIIDISNIKNGKVTVIKL